MCVSFETSNLNLSVYTQANSSVWFKESSSLLVFAAELEDSFLCNLKFDSAPSELWSGAKQLMLRFYYISCLWEGEKTLIFRLCELLDRLDLSERCDLLSSNGIWSFMLLPIMLKSNWFVLHILGLPDSESWCEVVFLSIPFIMMFWYL